MSILFYGWNVYHGTDVFRNRECWVNPYLHTVGLVYRCADSMRNQAGPEVRITERCNNHVARETLVLS